MNVKQYMVKSYKMSVPVTGSPLAGQHALAMMKALAALGEDQQMALSMVSRATNALAKVIDEP